MVLNTGYESPIRNPSEEIIKSKLRNLLTDEDGDFVVLVASEEENYYVQTVCDGQASFLVEYREGEQHYRAEKVPLTTTIHLFNSYLRRLQNWSDAIEWTDISAEMNR